MIDMASFMEDFLPLICRVLMTEPIVYFVAIAIVLCIAAIIRKILVRGG